MIMSLLMNLRHFHATFSFNKYEMKVFLMLLFNLITN